MSKDMKYSEVREIVYRRYDGKCAICGQPLQLNEMCISLIIPKSKGGADSFDNLQCTCKKCNGLKSDMLPQEFTLFIRNMLENSMRIEKGGVSV